MKLMFLFCLSATSFAALPTYWGVGFDAGCPLGSWRSNLYGARTSTGLGADLEFGQRFNSRLGYNIRFGTNDFWRGNVSSSMKSVQNPETGYWEPVPGFVPKTGDMNYGYIFYPSFGINYIISKYNADLYVNATLGEYRMDYYKTEKITVNGSPEYIFHPQETYKQYSVLGFEIGARKLIKWGLHGQLTYNYMPLDESKVKANSAQWVGVGLIYFWGNKRFHFSET